MKKIFCLSDDECGATAITDLVSEGSVIEQVLTVIPRDRITVQYEKVSASVYEPKWRRTRAGDFAYWVGGATAIIAVFVGMLVLQKTEVFSNTAIARMHFSLQLLMWLVGGGLLGTIIGALIGKMFHEHTRQECEFSTGKGKVVLTIDCKNDREVTLAQNAIKQAGQTEVTEGQMKVFTFDTFRLAQAQLKHHT
jgi:hypothetical protein